MNLPGSSFIIFLLGIIVLKQLLSYGNTKLYLREYRDVLQKNQVGYFGVGLNQPKLQPGQVCLIVIDQTDTIRDCRLIRGWSIFSKFHSYPEIINQPINSHLVQTGPYAKVIQAAIANAQKQQNSH